MEGIILNNGIHLIWVFSPILILHYSLGHAWRNLPRWLMWVLLAPGVIIHEMSHLIMAVICGHRVEKVALLTLKDDGTMGYVQHSYKNSILSVFTLFLIGIAPLLGCGAMFYLVSQMLLPDINLLNTVSFPSFVHSLQQYPPTTVTIWLYLSISMLGASVPSQKDMEGVYPLLLTLIVMALILPDNQLQHFVPTDNPIYTTFLVASSTIGLFAVVAIFTSKFASRRNGG